MNTVVCGLFFLLLKATVCLFFEWNALHVDFCYCFAFSTVVLSLPIRFLCVQFCTVCIWRKMSCWCCVRAENWIWSFFFRLWLIFTLCLCSLFDHTSREVYNAFIIGCLYSNVSVCFFGYTYMLFIKQSSNNLQ